MFSDGLVSNILRRSDRPRAKSVPRLVHTVCVTYKSALNLEKVNSVFTKKKKTTFEIRLLGNEIFSEKLISSAFDTEARYRINFFQKPQREFLVLFFNAFIAWVVCIQQFETHARAPHCCTHKRNDDYSKTTNRRAS